MREGERERENRKNETWLQTEATNTKKQKQQITKQHKKQKHKKQKQNNTTLNKFTYSTKSMQNGPKILTFWRERMFYFFCLGCFIFLYNCFEALKKRSSFCLRPCKKNVRWFWRLFKTVANFGFFVWRMCWASCPGPGPPPKNGQKNDPVSKCYRLKKSGGWTFDEQSFDFNEISNLCFRTSEHGYRKSLWSGRARLAHMFKI